MKGRGLLIGAAVVQLCGAAFFLLAGCIYAFLGSAFLSSMPQNANAETAALALRIVGIIFIAISGFTIFVSIRLIQCRRWAWIASLVMECLWGGLMLLGIVGMAIGGLSHALPRAVGVGESVVLFIVATPIYVVIGLLIGGRGATAGAAAPRA